MKVTLPLALAVASISPMVFSQVERDVGSHEHGTATLNVAVENASVFVELDSPWNNIIGFEHAPNDDEQQALLDAALGLLAKPDQLFSFDGGDCTFNTLNIENAPMATTTTMMMSTPMATMMTTTMTTTMTMMMSTPIATTMTMMMSTLKVENIPLCWRPMATTARILHR